MARLPRLVLPGQAHYLIQRAHGSGAAAALFQDENDRAAFAAALRETALNEQVEIHACALLPAELHLLATPRTASGLGRIVQALGRRYVSAYNRRHGRRGTLWDGRFRCAVVEPGALRLAALQLIDGLADDALPGAQGPRGGGPRDALLTDPPEVWQLGNTPFEREAAYRALLVQGLPAGVATALRAAALGGWAAGSAVFAAEVAHAVGRPTRPRPRGRPRTRAEGSLDNAPR